LVPGPGLVPGFWGDLPLLIAAVFPDMQFWVEVTSLRHVRFWLLA
jgi:hypothetical protein